MSIRDIAVVTLTDDIQGQAPQLTQGQGDLAGVVAILTIGHVQDPKHTVLNLPVLPQPTTALRGSRWLALATTINHNQFLHFRPRRRAQRPAFAHHPTTHLNIRPTVVLGEVACELRIRYPPVGAFLDTPVPLVVFHVVCRRNTDLVLQPIVDGLGNLAVIPFERP